MNTIYVLPKDELGGGIYRRIYLLIRKNRGDWAAAGATLGLACAMLSIILAALLWVVVPLLARSNFRSFLNVLDTAFFVLPLPLLALGAYCLDLLEKRQPALPLPTDSRHRPQQN